MNKTKKLYRSNEDKIIWGVCGGLGEYFEIDPLIIRILFILIALTGGAGIIIYLILAIIIPNQEKIKTRKEKGKKIEDFIEETQEKTQELAEEMKNKKGWFKNVKNIIGLGVILIGLNILFGQAFNFNIFSWINWGVIFGLVVLLIGVKIVLGSTKE